MGIKEKDTEFRCEHSYRFKTAFLSERIAHCTKEHDIMNLVLYFIISLRIKLIEERFPTIFRSCTRRFDIGRTFISAKENLEVSFIEILMSPGKGDLIKFVSIDVRKTTVNRHCTHRLHPSPRESCRDSCATVQPYPCQGYNRVRCRDPGTAD